MFKFLGLAKQNASRQAAIDEAVRAALQAEQYHSNSRVKALVDKHATAIADIRRSYLADLRKVEANFASDKASWTRINSEHTVELTALRNECAKLKSVYPIVADMAAQVANFTDPKTKKTERNRVKFSTVKALTDVLDIKIEDTV